MALLDRCPELTAVMAGNDDVAIGVLRGSLTGPLTLVLDAVGVEQPVDAPFEIDLGPAPQPGQVWEPGTRLEAAGMPGSVLPAVWILEG